MDKHGSMGNVGTSYVSDYRVFRAVGFHDFRLNRTETKTSYILITNVAK